MAAASMAAVGLGSVVPVRNVSGLSSVSSFGSPLVNAAAPLRPATRRNVMVARAALPEEQSGKTARREMLASLMAAGAALATAGSSFAASGPGTSGAQRTNEKADSLLKAADELTNNDSPPRFGPGRVGGGDTGRIAQQGGAGAIESLQEEGGKSIGEAKSAVSKAKTRIDGIFKGKKTGDLSDASAALNDAAGKVSGKVSSDVGSTKSKFSGTSDKAESLVGDAQSTLDNASKDGQSLVGTIKEKILNAVPQ